MQQYTDPKAAAQVAFAHRRGRVVDPDAYRTAFSEALGLLIEADIATDPVTKAQYLELYATALQSARVHAGRGMRYQQQLAIEFQLIEAAGIAPSTVLDGYTAHITYVRGMIHRALRDV